MSPAPSPYPGTGRRRPSVLRRSERRFADGREEVVVVIPIGRPQQLARARSQARRPRARAGRGRGAPARRPGRRSPRRRRRRRARASADLLACLTRRPRDRLDDRARVARAADDARADARTEPSRSVTTARILELPASIPSTCAAPDRGGRFEGAARTRGISQPVRRRGPRVEPRDRPADRRGRQAGELGELARARPPAAVAAPRGS